MDSKGIEQVIVGNVLGAGQGMNIARQIGVGLGVPIERIAYTVNMMCASGMQAVVLAAQAVNANSARVVLCGGTESMSNAPYLLARARTGYKLGDGVLIDSLLRDGLVDSFSHEHMGLTAERLAEMYKIGREDQDSYAVESHHRWAKAQKAGVFDRELVPLADLERDEHPRPETTLEKLGELKPAFKEEGTVTPGNASGINDGAAMMVVCDEETARKKGWEPLAVMIATASVGLEPSLMGLGPVHATRTLCEENGCRLEDFGAVEINEAFAAQTLACIKELALDREQVNTNGGAIAVGHPIGASGARLVTHVAHRIAAGEIERGLATLCVGGGMGAAVALEKV
jgi:acetyl-CoA C-acetyltransferase